MKKHIFGILICTLILIGIGAVSAVDSNSSDEIIYSGQNDEIAIADSELEELSIENDEQSVSANDSEIIGAESNDEKIAISDDAEVDEISAVESNDDSYSGVGNDNVVLASNVKEDNKLSSSDGDSVADDAIQTKTEYKTFSLAKMKFSKKYKKWALKGYKVPSKKNKKLWKKHKAYQKAYKKQLKIFKKVFIKNAKSMVKKHWKAYSDLYYTVKNSGKNFYIIFKMKCFRTHYYDPSTKKGWWE